MEIQRQVITSDDDLKLKFRKDYKFLRFYLLPFLSDFSADVRWMAEKVGVNVEQAFEYQDLLIESGYWVRLPNGGLSAKENYARFKANFDEFLNTAEFMTLSANISTRITDNGQCWFETFTIATTKELETELQGPAFAQPWKAHAFALTLLLHQRGVFTWPQWAEALARETREAQARGDADDGSTYYHHWLQTLEHLVVQSGIGRQDQIHQLEHAWEAAAARTPDGEPITLGAADTAGL